MASAPLEGTASAALAIERVKYTHDAMIDLIIGSPTISQNAIAKHFGYTVPWISRIFNSDAFQARLAARKADLVDPSLLASIDERLNTLANRSLELLHERMEQMPSNGDLLFKVAELSTKALGYGARQSNVTLQQSFVVALPQKSATDNDWIKSHGAGGKLLPAPADAEVVDVQEKSPDLAALVERLA